MFAEWTPELWPGSGLSRDPEVKQRDGGGCSAAVTGHVLLDISLLFPVLYLSLCWCFEDLPLSLLPVFLVMVYYGLSGVFPLLQCL